MKIPKSPPIPSNVDLPKGVHVEPDAKPLEDAIADLGKHWYAAAIVRGPAGSWQLAELRLPDEVVRKHLEAPIKPPDVLPLILARLEARFVRATNPMGRG